MNLKRLGDSLLARSTKLNDLIAKIECEIADKEEETSETKRANKFKPQKTCFFSLLHLASTTEHELHLLQLRCVENLEASVKILDQQFEEVDSVKVEVSSLETTTSKDADTPAVKESTSYLF